jgi:hypothetical protein
MSVSIFCGASNISLSFKKIVIFFFNNSEFYSEISRQFSREVNLGATCRLELTVGEDASSAWIRILRT